MGVTQRKNPMYLYRRNATYYFRMRIPQEVNLNIQEVRLSLNITNRLLATWNNAEDEA